MFLDISGFSVMTDALMAAEDEEALPGWLMSRGLPAMDVTAAATDPQVLAHLDRAVERANRAVSRAESIRKYVVLTTDFTVDNDYLTPSLKVKRSRVLRDFAGAIDDLYAKASASASASATPAAH